MKLGERLTFSEKNDRISFSRVALGVNPDRDLRLVFYVIKMLVSRMKSSIHLNIYIAAY